MKRIEIKAGKFVETPWLRTVEAAAYVGLSRTAFELRAFKVPHGGNSRTRIYHVDVLDRWVNGELPDAPFDADETAIMPQTRRPRIPTLPPGYECALIQPRSGKIFVPRNRQPRVSEKESL